MKQREPEEPGAGTPPPDLELRVPGFHTTAQPPRTPEQRDT